MKKIYDEVELVAKVLNEGYYLGVHDQFNYATEKGPVTDVYADAAWGSGIIVNCLIKYYSGLGYKPKEIKEELIRLCHNYTPENPNHRRFIDSMIRKVRKTKKYDLVSIKSVKIPRDNIEWFANLMNMTVNDFEDEDFDKGYTISSTINDREKFKELYGEKPFNINDAKVLFTLYIWREIQNSYRNPERNLTVALKGAINKLKRDANLPAGTKLCFTEKIDKKNYDKIILWKLNRCHLIHQVKMDFSTEEELRLAFTETMINRRNHYLAMDPPTKLAMDWFSRFNQSDIYILHFLEKLPNTGELVSVDFENPGEWFCGYIGEVKYSKKATVELPTNCPCCGKKFDRTSHNPNELCPDCAREAKKKYQREYKRKKRAEAKLNK